MGQFLNLVFPFCLFLSVEVIKENTPPYPFIYDKLGGKTASKVFFSLSLFMSMNREKNSRDAFTSLRKMFSKQSPSSV